MTWFSDPWFWLSANAALVVVNTILFVVLSLSLRRMRYWLHEVRTIHSALMALHAGLVDMVQGEEAMDDTRGNS